MKQQQKIFIEFVGLAASGKSTIARLLKTQLQQKGYTCAHRHSLVDEGRQGYRDALRHVLQFVRMGVLHPCTVCASVWYAVRIGRVLPQSSVRALVQIIVSTKMLQLQKKDVVVLDQGLLKHLAERSVATVPHAVLEHVLRFVYGQIPVVVPHLRVPAQCLEARRRDRGDMTVSVTEKRVQQFQKQTTHLLAAARASGITVQECILDTNEDAPTNASFIHTQLSLPHKDQKILFVITGLETGGAEVLLRRSCQYLHARGGYSVEVISLTELGAIGMQMQEDGCIVHALKMRVYTLPLAFIRLCLHIARMRPHVVHSHLFHANFFARLAGFLVRVPVIISTIHNENFGGPVREWLLRVTDRLCTHTIAISDSVEAAMLKKGVVPSHKFSVVQNGVDVDSFVPPSAQERVHARNTFGISDGIVVFTAIGRFREQKGYIYLIEAVERLAQTGQQNFLVRILGDGELKDAIAKEIQRRNLTQYVELCGNQTDITPHLFASDVFIMPSLWEGLPVALMEAAATGLPILASDVGAIPGVVTSKSVGVLVAPGDSGALSDGMRHFIALPERTRIEMGRHARDVISEKFSERVMMEAYEGWYSKLLGQIL